MSFVLPGARKKENILSLFVRKKLVIQGLIFFTVNTIICLSKVETFHRMSPYTWHSRALNLCHYIYFRKFYSGSHIHIKLFVNTVTADFPSLDHHQFQCGLTLRYILSKIKLGHFTVKFTNT